MNARLSLFCRRLTYVPGPTVFWVLAMTWTIPLGVSGEKHEKRRLRVTVIDFTRGMGVDYSFVGSFEAIKQIVSQVS